MSWTERAGLIRYRKGLTNRDYIRCVWRRQMQRDAMLATATHFELICFGRRHANRRNVPYMSCRISGSLP
ncbi:MAG UNVERIFIED_CONTAM: hypothetical protein LVR18_09045 [Planctomycetaceae bacterium]